ncbi:MAG: sigma 54-interacting transcriptional regulator [Oscillospiraceae bacterium]|nr:sigma 54-interacting transcriptional regulator [Oscillospiraceae bacterium]
MVGIDLLRLYESILDNIQDAVYVLDDKGNYLFVNSAYVKMLGMSRAELLAYNVHDFLKTGQIDVCLADIVYAEKRRVVSFQDVYDTLYRGRGNYRTLVVQTPLFDDMGHVKNVVVITRRLEQINEDYKEASVSSVVSGFSARNDKTALPEDGSIIAESEAMAEILKLASNIAQAESTVLVSGESGTGKEVIAQYIHQRSARREHPLVVINCASLPETLLEAELFGYEKGAFTGASATGKPGLFETAEKGTLFLDEINSLPLSLQGKLLRAIETKSILRIGSTKPRLVDFRLLTATNERLEDLVNQKKFRADLYYRLNVIPIIIPPLRYRRQDILPLTFHFLSHYCTKNNKNKSFSPLTLQKIEEYDWPGNVRELKNFVERSVVMSYEDTIEIRDIAAIAAPTEKAAYTQNPVPDLENLIEREVSLEAYLAECERRYVERALRTHKSSYAAAKALRTSQSSVMRRKKKYGI